MFQNQNIQDGCLLTLGPRKGMLSQGRTAQRHSVHCSHQWAEGFIRSNLRYEAWTLPAAFVVLRIWRQKLNEFSRCRFRRWKMQRYSFQTNLPSREPYIKLILRFSGQPKVSVIRDRSFLVLRTRWFKVMPTFCVLRRLTSAFMKVFLLGDGGNSVVRASRYKAQETSATFYLSSPDPGHTTGRSGRGGTRRDGGAGRVRVGRDADESVRPGKNRASCRLGHRRKLSWTTP